jgi:Tfp pilus assembly protein PilX
MMRRHQAHPRRGYSLTVVLVFLILIFALWSTVYRSTSSLLRIETNRSLQQSRNQGAMNALAQALQLLQYAKPSDPSNPNRAQFIYGVTVTMEDPTGACTSADYTVQFSPESQQGPNRWQVQVTQGTCSVPLPNPGATPQWP